MAQIIKLSDYPEFRRRLNQTDIEPDEDGMAPDVEQYEEDDDIIILSQGDMSDLVDAFKMIQDGLDKVKEITGLDYEEGAFQ